MEKTGQKEIENIDAKIRVHIKKQSEIFLTEGIVGRK